MAETLSIFGYFMIGMGKGMMVGAGIFAISTLIGLGMSIGWKVGRS